MKRVETYSDKVMVRQVTCPFCRKWINNMCSNKCGHLKKWDGNYAYFEDKEKI